MIYALTLREMFVPMLGLIAAVMATLVAVMIAIFGPFKTLRLPVESVQGSSRGVLNLVLFAPFLISFLLIDPIVARPALLVSLAVLVAAFVCYQKYGSQVTLYRYTKPSQHGFMWFKWVREDVIIGGSELTTEAEVRKQKTSHTVQRLLAEAEYDPDEIWTRQSRVVAQTWVERWYYGFMLCALLTIVLATLAGQTILSGEAPLVSAQKIWVKATEPGK